MNRNHFVKAAIRLGLVFGMMTCLFSCAGVPDVPQSEREYVEGIVVEGGVHGFRLTNWEGEVMRFISRGSVEYQPVDFHAYYGDRLGVSYYTKEKQKGKWHYALKVVLLAEDSERIVPRQGGTVGIIRETGMTRHMVYLPQEDITVPFYKKSGAKYAPKNWTPEEGNLVQIQYGEQAGRFVKKFEYSQMLRMEVNAPSMAEKTATGHVTEVVVHRSIHKAPSTFIFQLDSGDTWTIYTGGETQLAPEDLDVAIGGLYRIHYYRKLMSDLSLRYVAAKIEGLK